MWPQSHELLQCGCAINHVPDLLGSLGVSSNHASLPMEIRTRRVWRTWLERLLSWDRAYEAQAHRGSQEISQRAKTPEAAQALLLARCFVEEGVPLTDQKLQVEVRGDLIIVTHPPRSFLPFMRSRTIGLSLFSNAAPTPETIIYSCKFGRPQTPKPVNSGGSCESVGSGNARSSASVAKRLLHSDYKSFRAELGGGKWQDAIRDVTCSKTRTVGLS